MSSRPRDTRTKSKGILDKVRVDCFLLADGAQESGGKIYVMGGGWNQLMLPGPDAVTAPIGIAIRFLVPWAETNRDINVVLQLRDEDGNLLISNPPVFQMNVGRPPGVDPIDQPVHFALQVPGLQFQRKGDYSFFLTMDDEEIGQAKFRVTFTNDNAAVRPG